VRPWFRQPRAQRGTKRSTSAMHAGRMGVAYHEDHVGYIASPIGLGMMDTRQRVQSDLLPASAAW